MRRFAAKPLYAGGVLRVRVILHDHVVTPIQFHSDTTDDRPDRLGSLALPPDEE